MNEVLKELYQHKTWATLELIALCGSLGETMLQATTPGVYGTVHDTLCHLVASDEHYFATVTGERYFETMEGYPPLEELAERTRTLGIRWEALADDNEVPSREVTTGDGWRVPCVVPMAQAIHHANDHRCHVLSILGANGVDVPDLAVWGYAADTEQMWEVGTGG